MARLSHLLPLRTLHQLPTAIGLLALVLLSFTLPASASIDPFYERLFQDGTLALTIDKPEEAVKKLQLACFGMLEEPPRLGDCLTRLGLAHAAQEDREAFLATLGRVLEVERRFSGYSSASVPPEMRRNFERNVEQWAPTTSIQGVAAFKAVADRQLASSLGQTEPVGRRSQLDRLIAQDPGKVLWRQMQIELEMEVGNFPLAVELVDSLAGGGPGQGRGEAQDQPTLCLRGRAHAGTGSCSDGVMRDLETCAESGHVDRLRCAVKRQDRDYGVRVLAGMSEQARGEKTVRALERQIERLSKTPQTELGTQGVDGSVAIGSSAADDVVAVGSSSGSELQVAGEAAGQPPGDGDARLLDEGWSVLRSDSRTRFESTYQDVASLAGRYPDWDEAHHLAAELAYRLSRWPEAVSHFRAANKIVSARPEAQFYLAVALFKSGEQSAAEAMLERCLPSIQPSDYVRFWEKRIRSGDPS